MNRETPEAYAQRRANETRRAYIVTGMGHAWVKCPMNVKNAEKCGGIAATFRPRRRR